MLINFTVSNFRSIKDEILFNMAPAKRLQTMKEHVLVAKTRRKAEAMPVGAIYGANGSGKSNFIEALAFMKERVQSDEIIAAIPFRLTDDAQEEKPSTFSVLFSFQEIVYAYGFSIQDELSSKNGCQHTSRQKRRCCLNGTGKVMKITLNLGRNLSPVLKGERLSLGSYFKVSKKNNYSCERLLSEMFHCCNQLKIGS